MTAARYCPDCRCELPPNTPEGMCPQCLLKAGLGSQSEPGAPPASGFVPPAPADLAARFPQLEILELLGYGGMGAVYKARQPGLDRLVALKILPPDVAGDPAFAERFTREARALAKLNHPNIVGVHDFGRAEQLYYFVMEYVDGTNLRKVIQARSVTPRDALAIVPQVCDALQYAHDEGIVHRDIKPENILLDKRGRVKIADFGLAKLLGQDQGDSALTGTHQIMGTLRYMAPEQMEGARQVDHRADIYSLGVVFYELLTGELPLGHFAPPSQKVQVDVRLDEVVLRTLEKEPERRYQQAREVKTGVERITTQPPSPGGEQKTQPLTSGEAALVRQRLHGPAVGLLAAGVLSVLISLFVILWSAMILVNLAEAPTQKETKTTGSVTVTLTPRANMPSAATHWSLIAGHVLAVGLAGIVLLGTLMMRRLEFHSLAVAGAVVAMIPFSPAWIVGFPLGLWTWLNLRRPEIRAAFDRPGTEPPESDLREWLGNSGAWAALTCLIGYMVVFLPWAQLSVFGAALTGYALENWVGIVLVVAFGVGTLIMVVLTALSSGPLVRGVVCLVVALTVFGTTGYSLWEMYRGPQINSSSSTGDPVLGDLAQNLMLAMLGGIQARPAVAPFVVLALGSILLLLGVLQFVAARRDQRRRTGEVSVTEPGPLANTSIGG
jgi:serine/threonine protein kinase